MSHKLNIALQIAAVLVIISIIFAILFPVFQKVRGGGGPYRSCQSHLRYLATAFIQYTQDADEKMPNISHGDHTTWRQAVYPYDKDKDMYQCPDRDEAPNKIGRDGFSQDYAANYTGNYGRTQPDIGNGAFGGQGSEGLSYADFDAPSFTFELIESQNSDRPEFNIDYPAVFGPASHKLLAGHYGRSNYLRVDGHVKWLRPEETYQTNKHGKVLHNYWYRDIHKPLSANGVAVLKAAD